MNLKMKASLILVSFGAIASAQKIVPNPAAACQKLGASLAIENVIVNFAEHVPAGTNLTFTQEYNLSTCGLPSQVVSNDLCRVAMYVATSYRSGK
jgi:feruloyl esterase